MKYLIENQNRARTQRAFDYIKEQFHLGKPFTIEILAYKQSHSDSQRAYYWQALKQYGAHCGMNGKESEEIIHRECLCRLFGIEKTIRRGNMVIDVPKMTSKRLDKETYSELIDELIILAGEDGYVIPDPVHETRETNGATV